jgi:hypothetical protein
MKAQKWMGLILVALIGVIALMQSCSKEDDLSQQITENPGWTVRPDFTALDTRPPQVIEQFTLTEKDAHPVELLKSATIAGSDKYAVVVGISDYNGSSTTNDLEYCDDDAKDWFDLLTTKGFSPNNIILILDLNATAKNITDAVKALAEKAIAGKEIVFIYSGHGGKSNIVSTDLYYISSSWFKTTFSNASTSAQIFFSFDACQIGAMATDLNAKGRVIAVASNKNSYSYDGNDQQKNGVFTYYQMEGFDLGKSTAEANSKYACDSFIKWGTTNHTRVVPSYVDNFGGDFVY